MIEGLLVNFTQCGCIVISANANQIREFFDARDTFIRIRAVPDDITQAPIGIHISGCG